MRATPPPGPKGEMPPQSSLLAAWPHSVQMAVVALLSLATVLVAARSFSYLRHGGKPVGLPHGEQITYQIDLNHADRPELLQLPGIGEALAQRILDYRREHSGFRRVEDLRRVKGIGPLTLEKLRPWVCASEYDALAAEEEAHAPPVRVVATTDRTAASLDSAVVRKKLTGEDAPLDLNRASTEELKRLPGIGPKLADAIVAARQKKPFASVDDLRRVKGIGPKTLEKVRPFVTVGAEHVQLATMKPE